MYCLISIFNQFLGYCNYSLDEDFSVSLWQIPNYEDAISIANINDKWVRSDMIDFQVEMKNEDNTRVHPECIRVSLRLASRISYEWI